MSDKRVERLETTILDVPLRRPHRFARASMDAQPMLLVRVHTAGGVTGIGEGVVPGGPWWGGESVETMKAIVDTYLAPVVVGQEVDRIADIQQRMHDVSAENLFAKAAVEVALHDAWGRTLGVPVHTLLGGLARDSIAVTWALGTEEAGVVVDEALEKLDSGQHHSFKLKMGAQSPEDDTRRIVEIASKLACRAGVRVDLNARWDRLTSLRYLPRLVEAGVELIEQPVPAEDIEGMVAINAALPIPVMADESLRTPRDAYRLARLGAADVYSLKTTKSGGLRNTRMIADVAAAAAIPCHGGTAIEGPIGTAGSLHLACALPNVTFGSELFGPLLMREELLTTPLEYRDGHLHLPSGPGLGVELDPDAVAKFTRS
ncbi:MAG TPA: muconate/chloromuconate family cycloisomerase [Mycobacteriales bacterium]|jgi:muconate cycloisomerase|nr:muconate cycloisomerase [Actinomycetota bacterium]HEV7757008.1 muconate/chloromuconate family cycloisomerase [Mycobacteriales bacterium]